MGSKRSSYFSVSQCKPSRGRKRGICWCVDKYGVQLPGTDYSGGDIQCKDLESSNNNEWKKEGRTNPRPCPPLPNPKTTTWPRARAPPWITAVRSALCFLQQSCFFFLFQIEKKEKEKKSRQKNRLTKETPVIFFLFISVVDQALTSDCWRESPRRFTRSLDCLLVGHPIRGRSASCRRMKIYALLGYIFYRKAGGGGFNATLCKGKQIKSGTSIEIRPGLGCGTWCHCGMDNLAE